MLLVGAIASALAAVVMGIVTVVYFATMIIKPTTLPEFLWSFLDCCKSGRLSPSRQLEPR